MPAKQNHADEPEYLVTTYRDGKFTEERLTREEVMALDPDDVDFLLDDVFDHIRIRTKDGDVIEHLAEFPRVGITTRKLGLVMMNRPGEFLAPLQLAALTGNTWFRNPNTVAARLAVLRSAFKDDARAPWFFLTRRHPYAIAWSADRSWRHIEAIALPQNGKSEEGE